MPRLPDHPRGARRGLDSRGLIVAAVSLAVGLTTATPRAHADSINATARKLVKYEGEVQQMSKQAERFARQLEGRFGIAAALADERLTTREAWQVAIDSGEHKSKQQIDSLSAALITETWLRDHPES